MLKNLKLLSGVATQVKARSKMKIRSPCVCRFEWLLGPVEGWRAAAQLLGSCSKTHSRCSVSVY